MTNVERLAEAECVDPSKLSEVDKKRLNRLTQREVEQLIALHEKLGPADNDAVRPAF